LRALSDTSAPKVTLPFVEERLKEARALMGEDFWPYGVESNRKVLDYFLDQHHAQGLSKRRVSVDELFPTGRRTKSFEPDSNGNRALEMRSISGTTPTRKNIPALSHFCPAPGFKTSGAPLAGFCCSEPGGSANRASPPVGEGVRTVAKLAGNNWTINGRNRARSGLLLWETDTGQDARW